MLANMACSLIEHKRINTTVAKAKALKQFIEPLVTKSKEDSTHNRRIVFSRLRQKEAVAMLFRDVAVKVGDRPGGYTRIIKLGNRLGDNADMAMIELVDYNEIYNSDKPKKKTTRRSRRRGRRIRIRRMTRRRKRWRNIRIITRRGSMIITIVIGRRRRIRGKKRRRSDRIRIGRKIGTGPRIKSIEG